MPEWTMCPHCRLKHGRRADGHCPRCKQPLAGESGPPASAALPDVYDGRNLPGSRYEREASVRKGRPKMATVGMIVMTITALLAGKLIARTVATAIARVNVNAPPPGVQVGSPEHLRYVAEKMNATLPRDIDDETRLTHVSAREREFVYEYELRKYSSRDLDTNAFLAQVTPFVRNQSCGSPAMKGFWKHGITATYRYLGNDRVAVGSVSVSASDCGTLVGGRLDVETGGAGGYSGLTSITQMSPTSLRQEK